MRWFYPSVESVKRRIASAWRRGNSEAQERIASDFARRRPDEPRAWAIWANARLKARDYAGAETILKDGIKLHPSADPGSMGRTSGELVRRTEPCDGLVVIRTSRTSWRSSPASVEIRSPALGM